MCGRTPFFPARTARPDQVCGGPRTIRPRGRLRRRPPPGGPVRARRGANRDGLAHLSGATMTNDADLMPDLGQEDAFEVQMRGYSRRQVDEYVARTRSQIRD